MILDAQSQFSNSQLLTTGTQLATNNYGMTVVRDVGRGRNLRLFAEVVTAFSGGTSLQANAIESSNSDMSSASVIVTGPILAEANLTAGANLLAWVIYGRRTGVVNLSRGIETRPSASCGSAGA